MCQMQPYDDRIISRRLSSGARGIEFGGVQTVDGCMLRSVLRSEVSPLISIFVSVSRLSPGNVRIDFFLDGIKFEKDLK